ncbi:MAG TPA: hypothetical protein VF618_03145 [Thermoanaerobaculia bacterium]
MIFDVTDDFALNAMALRIGQRDAILVNGGLAIALFALFSKFMCHSDIFPWIGAPQSEHVSVAPLEGFPDSFTNEFSTLFATSGADPARFVEALRPQVLPEQRGDITVRKIARQPVCSIDIAEHLPADAERRHFAVKLWQWAMCFVLYHELAHIMRGHVDYLMSVHRAQGLPEIGRTGNADLSRSQEFQADMYAAVATLLPLFTIKSDANRGRKVYAWGFTAAVLFSLLRALEGTKIADAERTHPPALDRLTVCALGATTRARMLDMGGDDMFGDAIRGFFDVDRLLPSIVPGRYTSLVREGGAPQGIGIPAGPLMANYLQHDAWRRFDRLEGVVENIPVTMLIPYE